MENKHIEERLGGVLYLLIVSLWAMLAKPETETFQVVNLFVMYIFMDTTVK